jgi:hypothetical protein
VNPTQRHLASNGLSASVSVYRSELDEDQSASLFALKRRFIEEACQEQFGRAESRFNDGLPAVLAPPHPVTFK